MRRLVASITLLITFVLMAAAAMAAASVFTKHEALRAERKFARAYCKSEGKRCQGFRVGPCKPYGRYAYRCKESYFFDSAIHPGKRETCVLHSEVSKLKSGRIKTRVIDDGYSYCEG